MAHLMQSAMLYSGYYALQINVHRPFIPSPRKPSRLSFPSLAICTNAARSCLHVLDVHAQRTKGQLVYQSQVRSLVLSTRIRLSNAFLCSCNRLLVVCVIHLGRRSTSQHLGWQDGRHLDESCQRDGASSQSNEYAKRPGASVSFVPDTAETSSADYFHSFFSAGRFWWVQLLRCRVIH